MLGGIFASIIAPQIFNALSEFPLRVVLGMLCRPGLAQALADKLPRMTAVRLAVGGAAIVAVLSALSWMQILPASAASQISLVVILSGGVMMLMTREQPLSQTALCVLTGASLLALPTAMNLGRSERSFFGVHRIVVERAKDEDGRLLGEARILLHGTTLHGIERIRDAQDRPVTGLPVPSMMPLMSRNWRRTSTTTAPAARPTASMAMAPNR